MDAITKLSGGSGAGADFDGTDAVQTHMTNSRLTDPEVLEWRFPVLLKALLFAPTAVVGIIMAAMASVAYVSWNR